MPALTSYTLLKPHPEVLQRSPSHYLWYCCDIMTNSIFQFVSCLRPTFKDVRLQVSPREEITRG
jgi:hypothetical protein